MFYIFIPPFPSYPVDKCSLNLLFPQGGNHVCTDTTGVMILSDYVYDILVPWPALSTHTHLPASL